MQIHGFNKLTLLDFPGHVACTIFTGSCNLRCPFCHNASLVLHPDSQPAISEATILRTLARRKKVLEGVCISGGEPTLWDDLPQFAAKIKAMGYLVKLDTNGTRFDMLKKLIDDKTIDFVSMDIKTSKENYTKVTGVNELPLDNVCSSVDLLLSNIVDYEFRTTVVDGLHSEADFYSIGPWLKGAKAYFLQNFKDSGDLIMPGLRAASQTDMERYRIIMSDYVPETQLRGIE